MTATAAAISRQQQSLQTTEAVGLLLRVTVLVDLLGRAGVGVTEDQLHVADRQADVLEHCGSGVPQLVERDPANTGVLHGSLESLSERFGLDRRALAALQHEVLGARSAGSDGAERLPNSRRERQLATSGRYRVRGLDRLLRELLGDYPDDEGLALAARIMFAVEPGSRGSTLTQRRERVAREIGYDVDHVRKAIQSKVVEQMAWMIHLDSQTYTPRGRGVPPPIAISGDTPQIASEDLQTEERLEHEVALSQLWALVYALRAEVLTVDRFKRYPPAEGADEMLAKARERRDALDTELGDWIENYVERWGERIGHGEAAFDARRLQRLSRGTRA